MEGIDNLVNQIFPVKRRNNFQQMRKNDQENQKKANIIERIIPLDRGSVMTHRESPSVEDGYRPVYHKKLTGAIRSCHFFMPPMVLRTTIPGGPVMLLPVCTVIDQ
jgi:hypothetical protein